tara:strand:+ start:408 stop:557 length:150 start_codon:yes stop_codon:yes gene_type:complete
MWVLGFRIGSQNDSNNPNKLPNIKVMSEIMHLSSKLMLQDNYRVIEENN